MCGINGIFNIAHRSTADLGGHIEQMNDLLRHRGPDDEGAWVSQDIGLAFGHRRLSIIDLSPRGHQPMFLPDGTAIVYNGEIYNYKALKKDLPDFPFQSDSDTELILALYAKKGRACLDDLEGMFAFAIWDPHRQGLFIARDPIGKKPLYFSREGGRFSFSSEVRSLLAMPWVKGGLDEKAYYHFLTFGFVPPPMSMFNGIEKLEQGHSLWVDGEGVRQPERFWQVNFETTPDTEAELSGALRSHIERSVDLRMVSDVPVGLFLSGGVDSTALAALMKQRSKEELHSYSISFADQPSYDEADMAAQTAKQLGFKHEQRIVTQSDMHDMMSNVADIFDEPLADPTCVPIHFLSQMARAAGTKVVLTGDGPDELLLGYRNWRRYFQSYPWFRRYSALPGFVRKFGLSAGRNLKAPPLAMEMLHRASRDEELFWGSAPSFKESEKTSLLADGYADQAAREGWNTHDVIAHLRSEYDSIEGFEKSDENWMAFLGLRFVIPNFYLHRADRLGMANSIELRAPYLDRKLVNFALSVSSKWKLKDGVPKYIFKKSVDDIVRPEVITGAKRGFCVPIREWGADLMSERVMDELSSANGRLDLMNKSAVRSMVNDFKAGNNAMTNNIWTLYFLAQWMDRWMETETLTAA